MTSEKKAKAITTFTKTFGGNYDKLGPQDIDYKIYDSNKVPIAYAEVVIRNRTIREAYPLYIQASRLVKLTDKRLNPVIIWACEDGIIYAKVKDIYGQIKWGGLPPQPESNNNNQLICYYDKQKQCKYIKY
jgi:hypothetical protein